MDSEVLIEVKQLSRHYPGNKDNNSVQNNFIAVDNISFSLQRGEILGFLGPNGAGKSTTMKMLSGNLAPTLGSITIAGMDLMDNPTAAKAKIGYLPDTPPLYKELSVDEYLRYCAQLNRISKNNLASALNTAKQRCGLSDYGKRIINNLSKGYQQRVGIAQAIIHLPDIVILDEPTVGLDPIQMVAIRQLIKDLGKSHSVLISSHILPEIQAICNNVQIINQGKLVLKTSIEHLTQHMQTQTLRFSCTQTIDAGLLEAISGVLTIEQEGNSITMRYQADTQKTTNITIAQQVIILAQQHQWGLYEIYAQQQSLEDIFISLTSNTDASGVSA